MLASVRGARRTKKTLAELPLGTADQRLLGHRVEYFQQWLTHEHDDDYWQRLNLRGHAAGMPDQAHLATGWHDICLASTLADYAALREAGKTPRLVIGPWYHFLGSTDKTYTAEVDGCIRRLTPNNPPAADDGTRRIRIDLVATAHRFRTGHRIRLQISSGAHPRLVLNPGTGDPLATATDLRAADQEIFHDPHHVSTVELPTLHTTSRDPTAA